MFRLGIWGVWEGNGEPREKEFSVEVVWPFSGLKLEENRLLY